MNGRLILLFYLLLLTYLFGIFSTDPIFCNNKTINKTWWHRQDCRLKLPEEREPGHHRKSFHSGSLLGCTWNSCDFWPTVNSDVYHLLTYIWFSILMGTPSEFEQSVSYLITWPYLFEGRVTPLRFILWLFPTDFKLPW